MGRRAQHRGGKHGVAATPEPTPSSSSADVAAKLEAKKKSLASQQSTINAQVTTTEVVVDCLKREGSQIIEQLQSHADRLTRLSEEYFEQGLLGHHVDALKMRDATLEKIRDTRLKLGIPESGPVPLVAMSSTSAGVATSASDEPTSKEVEPISENPPQKSSTTTENGTRSGTGRASQEIVSSSEWSCLAANDGEDECAHIQYRWRDDADPECVAAEAKLEVRGSTASVNVDISDSAVRLEWPATSTGNVGSTLRLSLDFITDPGMCQAARRRKADELTLTFPKVAGMSPQAPVLASALRGEDGAAFIDGFMTGCDADALRRRILDMWQSGVLDPGEIEGGDALNEGKLRSDAYTYMEERDPQIMKFTKKLDRMVLQVAKDVPDLQGIKLIRGQPMVAVYAGAGARYIPHFDSVNCDNGRVLTCILYLNPFWRETDGAQLRLWPQAKTLRREGESRDFAPLHGRLVAFLCRNLHEVLPVSTGKSIEPRIAISCWYYDSDIVPSVAESQRVADAPH